VHAFVNVYVCIRCVRVCKGAYIHTRMTCMHQPFRLSLSMATAHKAAASNEKTPSLSAINLKGGGGEGGHSPSMPNIFSSDSVRNGGDGQAGVIRNSTGRGIVRSTTPPYSPPGKSQYRSLPSSSRGTSAATPMQVSAGTPAHIRSAIGVDFSGRKRDPEQLGRGKVGERGRREEGGEVDGDVGVEKMLGVNADNIMGPIVDVYSRHPSWCVPRFFC